MRPLVCLLIFLTFAVVAREHRVIAPVPAQYIFENVRLSVPQLSPSGEYISIFESDENEATLSVIDTSSYEIFRLVDLGMDGRLNDYQWLTEKDLLVNARAANEEVEKDILMVMRFSKSEQGEISVEHFVFPAQGYVLGPVANQPGMVLYALEKRDETQLFIISPEALAERDFDNAIEIKDLPDDGVTYFYDEHADLLMSLFYDEDKETVELWYRDLYEGEWQVLLKDFNTEYTFEPVGFLDKSTLAVLSDINTDKVALYAYDINSQSFKNVLYEHANYDLVDANVNYGYGTVASASYYRGGRYEINYIDSIHGERQQTLDSNIAGRKVVLISYSYASDTYLAAAYASDAPPDYYTYDVKNKQAKLLFSTHPELDNFTFSKTQVFTFDSDGTEIEAYFNPAVGPRNGVLLVMPHGGPVGVRDTSEFNQEVQFYATRGYDVLRVNYHGSEGFGKAFKEGGVGEFGRQIERDIMGAIGIIREKYSTPHICAIGASYGAYSALMLNILNPDLLDCAIARFGIYDLPLLFNESNLRRRDEWLDMVRNTVGEYSDSLKDISPVYLAENITVPVLVTAGYADKVASFEHTQRLDYVLNKLGKDYETQYYYRTGHGHNNWQGDRHEHQVIDEFIRRKLHLPENRYLQDNKKLQALYAEDLLETGDTYVDYDNVKNDEEKAHLFYQKAADLGSSEALYKLAKTELYSRSKIYDVAQIDASLKLAAEQGIGAAAYLLASAYYDGIQLPKDDQAHLIYAQKAIELGYGLRAEYLVARAQCLGIGIAVDVERCFETLSQRPDESLDEYIDIFWSRRNMVADIIRSNQIPAERLLTFLATSFDITFNNVSFTRLSSGIAKDQPNGKTDYITESTYLNEEDTEFGVLFEIHPSGLFGSSKDRLGVVVAWYNIEPDGSEIERTSTLLTGFPTYDWSTIVKLTERDSSLTALRVEVRDIHNEVLFKQVFPLHNAGDTAPRLH